MVKIKLELDSNHGAEKHALADKGPERGTSTPPQKRVHEHKSDRKGSAIRVSLVDKTLPPQKTTWNYKFRQKQLLLFCRLTN